LRQSRRGQPFTSDTRALRAAVRQLVGVRARDDAEKDAAYAQLDVRPECGIKARVKRPASSG